MNVTIPLFILLMSMPVGAKDLKDQEQTKDLCTRAAALFATGDADEAYEILTPHWPLPKEEIQNLGYETKSKLGMVAERFGASIGAEYVGTAVAGHSLIRHTYLIKRENHALRFACTFYKPKDKWLINGVFWDDSLTELLRDSP